MARGRFRPLAVLAGCSLLVMTAVLSSACAVKPEPPGPPPTALDLIPQRGELRVCSTGDYRPFTYLDPATGKWSGIDISMARDLAAALKVKLTMVPTAWGTVADDVAANKCDIAMGGISVDLERAKHAAYSDSYLTDGKAPVVRCPEVARFRTLAQIDQPNVRVIVNPDGGNAKYDRAALKRATVITHPDNNTIFDQILRGRADLMITDASEGRWQATQHPGQLCLVPQERPLTVEPKAYLLPRRDIVFQQWVNLWLHKTVGDGTYQRFARSWTG